MMDQLAKVTAACLDLATKEITALKAERAAWNTRAPDPESAAVIAAARKMATHYTAVFTGNITRLGTGYALTESLAAALERMDEGKADE